MNPQFFPYPNFFSLTHILFPMVTNQFPQLKIPSNHSHLQEGGRRWMLRREQGLETS